jgi:hypothetical protein
MDSFPVATAVGQVPKQDRPTINYYQAIQPPPSPQIKSKNKNKKKTHADPAAARVDFVEFTFKDDFISRADMWRFKKQVYGRAAYIGACRAVSSVLCRASSVIF